MNKRLCEFIRHLNISVFAFEKKCGISNGTVSKMGRGTRQSTLDKISKQYPQLNINWLLTGEGFMLNENANSILQCVDNKLIEGNNNTNNQNGIDSQTINKFLDEIAAQRRLAEKASEQTDRLLNIIEKLKLN